MKLTDEQLYKLLQTNLISRDKYYWTYSVAMSTEPITLTQYNTAVEICNLNVVEQRKYIIFQDKLLLCPTNKQTHILEQKMAKTDK